ncbi:cadherin EGF LAG seven-pass G-type receptor 1-like, partial [Ruditapes philippinarum]|uniref:cadherin EGF LAG seven-pass G-type receptor 1-like n=1 Tax=Ruditapes philippinarum TaxID=129788 RepID=UPI00295B69A1
MDLNWKCKESPFDHHIVIRLQIASSVNASLCFKNCTKINSPYNLTILEYKTDQDALLDFKICDDQLHANNPYANTQVNFSGGVLDEGTRNDTKYIKLKKSMTLDYEHPPKNLTSYVKIKGSIALTINIKIGDADDQGIEFEQTVYNCSISEGTLPNVTTECKVRAKDLDTGINQQINYELFSVTPSDKDIIFDVTSEGSLQLLKKLDREKVNAYYITVKGFQTNNKDRANYTSIKVDVTDIDDNKPEMLKTTHNVSVMENSPVGTILCVVSATDRDIGVNAKFRYKMNNTSVYFAVDESTGLITVKASVDRETIQSEELK